MMSAKDNDTTTVPAVPPEVKTEEDRPHRWSHFFAYAGVAVLLGLTQSLGVNLVSANLSAIQGTFGATAADASWLLTAYFATNLSATLLLTKARMQYGLRLFADLGIVLFLLVSIVHLFVHGLSSAIAVRMMMGLVAAPLSSLTVLYMVEAVPPAMRVVGVLLGFAASQLGAPLSRIISEDLLQYGQWQGLHMVDVALALLSLAAINVVRVTPPPTQKMFNRGDFISFVFYASALALFCVVLTQGRLHWWTDTPWLGFCLAAGVGCFGLFVLIELGRPAPMIDLRWVTSPFMLRFMLAVLLFRLVLSEQTVGAVGLLNTLGMNNDQMHGLFMWISAGTVGGFVLTMLLLKTEKLILLGITSLLLIIPAAWLDAGSTSLTRPEDLYFTQTLLALASSMFLAFSLLVGFKKVMEEGMVNFVSFIAVFSSLQALGALLGSALFTTYIAIRQKLHFAELGELMPLSDPQVAQRVAQLSGAYGRVLTDSAQRSTQGVSLLSQQLTRESYILAYNDLFRLIAVLSVLILVWLLMLWFRARRAEQRAALDAVSASPVSTSTTSS